jgi:hypothetical protein
MLDPETCLIALYVEVDTFCKVHVPEPAPKRVGRPPSLCVSEIVTLAIFGQWAEFRSERGFARWAERHLRELFPRMPHRSQLNRAQRQHLPVIIACALHLGQQLLEPGEPYELLDGTGVAVRNDKRGGPGWFPDAASIGSCGRLRWFEGFRLLLCTAVEGIVTGWGCGSATTSERALAETFFAGRAEPDPALSSVGTASGKAYLADMGFSGQECQARWRDQYGATVRSSPPTHAKAVWPPVGRRALARIRQIIESVFRRLLHDFRLEYERPHTLGGFLTRLAAKIGLHHACIWLNRQHGQPDLAIAGFIDW